MTKKNLTLVLAGITVLTTIITSGFTSRQTNYSGGKGNNLKLNQHGTCSGNSQKHASGSVTGYTNSIPDGPGTCSNGGCHGGGTATPVFTFTGTPAFTGNTYVPGTVYTIAIKVTGYPKFGFDLEMLNGTASTSTAIGTFAALTNSQVKAAGTYPLSITHTSPILSSSTATFHWTAPASGTVYVYGDGLGVNGDGGTSGDNASLYTLTLTPAVTGSAPVASFTASTTTICAGHSVTLTDNSTNTPTSWNWTTTGGSPASSSTQNPSVTYSTAGTYTVTLVSTNSTGTSSPVSHTITVNAIPSIPVITLTGNTLSSSATTGNQWYLNTVLISGATNQTYPATSSGSYTVVVSNSFGCTSTSAATVYTASNSPVANFTASATTVCALQSITLTDNSTNTPTSWNWTMTGGTPASSSTQSPSVTYSTAGTYTVTLVSTNSSGASSPASHTITVNAIPAVPTITLVGNTLTSSSTTGNQWYLNSVLISGATSQTYTATANGSYTVAVTASGCSSTSAATVLTTTGISAISDNNILNIFPNPSNGVVNISLAGKNEHTIIEVINNLGQLVYTEKIVDCTGDCNKIIDMSSFKKGIYLFRIVTDGKILSKKIMLTK